MADKEIKKVTWEEVKDSFLPYKDDKTRLKDVILIGNNAYIKKGIKNFMHERELLGTIRDYDLNPSKTLIFTGAPGLGKTFLAKAIKNELGVPMYIIDIGELLKDANGLGKLNKIFEYVWDPANQPCILFMDECDGIAKSRENANVEESVKRITNLVMQRLNELNEQKDNKLIVIAASNYGTSLDQAFKSRFVFDYLFNLPDQYLPFIQMEIDRNKMFELVNDIPEDQMEIFDGAMVDYEFSIRELNAKVQWVEKIELIKRHDSGQLTGEVIPIRLSSIMKEICQHIKFAYDFDRLEQEMAANKEPLSDIDFGDDK